MHSGENNGIKDYENIADSVPDINALNAGGGLIRADEANKRHQEQIEQRYQRNLAIESQNANKKPEHINGQGTDIWSDMSFGPRIEELYPEGNLIGDLIRKLRAEKAHYDFGTVGNAGCEAIAVYNTLLDLGKYVPLSQIIYDSEKRGYQLWNGWLGTKIWKVDDILNMYGVSTKEVNPLVIQAAENGGLLKDGQIFVATSNNGPIGPLNGIHTYEIVYSPSIRPDQPWMVYNRYSNDTNVKYYESLPAIVNDGSYIHLYEIDTD